MVKFTLGSKCQTVDPVTLNAVRLLYIQNQVVMLMIFSSSDSSLSAPTTEVVQSTTFTWTQVSGLVDSVYSLSLRAIHDLIECYVDQVTYKLLSSLCVSAHLKICTILLPKNDLFFCLDQLQTNTLASFCIGKEYNTIHV